MADHGEFFVAYPGKMTPDDRQALTRPGFKVYENGVGFSEPFWGDEAPRELTYRQVVRVTAADEQHAREQVVDALGHEPDGLHVIGQPLT